MKAYANSDQMSPGTQQCMVPNDPLWPEKMKTRAMTYLKRYDSCTQSILWAFMEVLGMQNRVDRVGDGARTIAEILQDLDARGELFRV